MPQSSILISSIRCLTGYETVFTKSSASFIFIVEPVVTVEITGMESMRKVRVTMVISIGKFPNTIKKLL